jgi:hypothetical protein
VHIFAAALSALGTDARRAVFIVARIVGTEN